MTQRLDALTGMRFFAALMIVFHHVPGNIWFTADAYPWINTGSGVSFFFVLSGFILHYNYRDRIAQIPLWRFYALRYLRLWPAHLAGLGVAFFLAPGWWSTWLPNNLAPLELTSIVFMFHWIFPDQRVFFAWNGPSWSIATELAFYAAFPFLSIAIARRPGAAMAGVVAFVLAYLMFARFVLFNPDVQGNMAGLVYINPFSRILEFALGLFACELAMFRHPQRLRAAWFEWPALALVIIGVLASKSILPYVGGVGTFHGFYVYIACLAPVFCIFIVVISRGSGMVSAFLGHPLLVWLGNASFSLYLVHQPIILFFKSHLANLLWWQQVPLFLLFTIGLSGLIYRWIEMPIHEVARKALLSRRMTPVADTRTGAGTAGAPL
jgi:peptidoglycan/LPS O-acetylase OafA/YrhL